MAQRRVDFSSCHTPSPHLQLHPLQISFGRKASCLVSRVRKMSVDYHVELSGLSLPHVHGATSSTFDPSLHTEGFGLVASSGAVMDDDRHEQDPFVNTPGTPLKITAAARPALSVKANARRSRRTVFRVRGPIDASRTLPVAWSAPTTRPLIARRRCRWPAEPLRTRHSAQPDRPTAPAARRPGGRKTAALSWRKRPPRARTRSPGRQPRAP